MYSPARSSRTLREVVFLEANQNSRLVFDERTIPAARSPTCSRSDREIDGHWIEWEDDSAPTIA